MSDFIGPNPTLPSYGNVTHSLGANNVPGDRANPRPGNVTPFIDAPNTSLADRVAKHHELPQVSICDTLGKFSYAELKGLEANGALRGASIEFQKIFYCKLAIRSFSEAIDIKWPESFRKACINDCVACVRTLLETEGLSNQLTLGLKTYLRTMMGVQATLVEEPLSFGIYSYLLDAINDKKEFDKISTDIKSAAYVYLAKVYWHGMKDGEKILVTSDEHAAYQYLLKCSPLEKLPLLVARPFLRYRILCFIRGIRDSYGNEIMPRSSQCAATLTMEAMAVELAINGTSERDESTTPNLIQAQSLEKEGRRQEGGVASWSGLSLFQNS